MQGMYTKSQFTFHKRDKCMIKVRCDKCVVYFSDNSICNHLSVVSVNEFSTCVSLESVDHNSEIDTLRYIYEWVLPSARPVDEIRCVPW